METFSMLLALCVGNSPVPGEFPSQRPVTRSLMFSLIWPWTNGWDTSDLLGHRTNYDVTVISETISEVVTPSCQFDRLLHSLSLVAVGLSVGYKTWSTISWHWHIAFAWSKYRFRNASVAMESWLTWPVRIFQRPLTVPLHSNNGNPVCLSSRLCAIRAVHGDSKTVYVFISCPQSHDLLHVTMETNETPPLYSSGLILGLHPANERWYYFVTTSLIGWEQT